MNAVPFEVRNGQRYLGGAIDLFRPPRYMPPPGAWVQHVPFARWLVDAVRPESFVELGTEHGLSYFAVCDAVETAKVPATCFAVDHWVGDAHTGAYGESVFEAVAAENVRYQSFSTLVRSKFEDALPHFADESIDVLHIDGHHAYESARGDFESWIAKVRTGGIVLLHDTNVRKLDFGVHRLMGELEALYPTLDFPHGNGLGVVVKGEHVDPTIRLITAGPSDERDQFVALMQWLGRLMQGAFDSAQVHRLNSALDRSTTEISRLCVERAADRADTEQLQAEFDERLRLIEGEANALRDRLAECDRERGELEHALQDVLSSPSWKITRPLRAVKRAVGPGRP